MSGMCLSDMLQNLTKVHGLLYCRLRVYQLLTSQQVVWLAVGEIEIRRWYSKRKNREKQAIETPWSYLLCAVPAEVPGIKGNQPNWFQACTISIRVTFSLEHVFSLKLFVVVWHILQLISFSISSCFYSNHFIWTSYFLIVWMGTCKMKKKASCYLFISC